jgi:thiamine monophosphate synthase
VGIDGGVSLDNLILARNAGVDYACVGSRILLADDPATSFSRFEQTASTAVK